MFDLDKLVAEYIESEGGWPTLSRSPGREGWAPDILHATDVSKCPRQVALRLRGDKPEPHPPQKIRQFWAANQQHELIYASLRKAHLLFDAEVPVDMPDGWSGTADMILIEYHNQHDHARRLHVADSKNPHPNTVRYYPDYPKYDDMLQVSVYAYFMKQPYLDMGEALEDEGENFYTPLGGAGEYKPCRYPLLDAPAILPRMALLEQVRDDLPTIPDVLKLEVRWAGKGEGSSKRMYKGVSGGDIVLGTNWQCGHCRFKCPNREVHSKLLAKVGVKKGNQAITFETRADKYLDEIENLLAEDAKA